MYGYIYLTTNLINNKKYIGQHKASRFSESYKGSGTRISKAFKKYGKQNFKVIMLESVEDVIQLNVRERYWIAYYDAVARNDFYNVASGGQSEKEPKPHSNYNKTENFSKGTVWVGKDGEYHRIPKEKLKDFIKRGFKKEGPARSALSKERYKASKKDLIIMTDGNKTVYVKPEEYNFYINAGFKKGRIPSLEKGRASKWIYVTNEIEERRILPEELEIYLQNGFRRGRKKFEHFNRTTPAHNKGKKLINIEGKLTYN